LPDDIDTIIEEAKRKRKQSDFIDGMKNAQEEGILPDAEQPKQDDGAFAKSAVGVTDAQHGETSENVQQTHSNISKNILAPMLEIEIIQEAVKKENDAMKKFNTLDDLTRRENNIIQEEIDEILKDFLRTFVSLDARGRNDANMNLNSLVAGEQARLSTLAMGLNPQPGSPGFWSKLKGMIGIGKK